MKNLFEIHGVELIRNIAKDKIKIPELKERVWSEEMNCWGFFSNKIKESDIFLIMGCSNPGDMFRTCGKNINLFDTNHKIIIEPKELYVILEFNKIQIEGSPYFAMNLLSSENLAICSLLEEYKNLFKTAWTLSSTKIY